MAREQLKTLTEPMYYIMLSLIGENHGYGIMQNISRLTEGRVAVGAGTLYALLGRFESEGIIQSVAEVERRKIYRLTEKGREILQGEYARLNQLVQDGRHFFDQDGNLLPPSDTGSGISMPVEEFEAAGAGAADVLGTPGIREAARTSGRGGLEQGPKPPANEKPPKEKKDFGFGGLEKGLAT